METEGARHHAVRQVDSLQGLIAKMEQDLKKRAKAAETASLQGRARRPQRQAQSGGAEGTCPAEPGQLLSPPPGVYSRCRLMASRFAILAVPTGGWRRKRAFLWQLRPGAQVTTPCDGWVVYAGPFRSYGQLLILNAGGGYMC